MAFIVFSQNKNNNNKNEKHTCSTLCQRYRVASESCNRDSYAVFFFFFENGSFFSFFLSLSSSFPLFAFKQLYVVS